MTAMGMRIKYVQKHEVGGGGAQNEPREGTRAVKLEGPTGARPLGTVHTTIKAEKKQEATGKGS